MKNKRTITPGQALALALADAAQSCRIIRQNLEDVRSTPRSRKAKDALRGLAAAAARLDEQLTHANRLVAKVRPQRADDRDPAARRRADVVAAAGIDREIAAISALAEEASGDTPNARSAARLLRDREDGAHRRIDRLAARRGATVRSRARRAHGQVEIAVEEAEAHQEANRKHQEGPKVRV